MTKTVLVCVGCTLLLLSCSRPSPKSSNPSTPLADACALLTSEEIAAVQGQPVQETKPSEQRVAGFAISQCYFVLPTPNNSVVVTVTQTAPDGVAGTARKAFEKMFGEKEGEEEREGEEEKRPPLKVEGLGEEAFWTGGAIGGALYILRGDAYLRISVGGAGDGEAKMHRSKKLAELALRRL